MVKKIAFYVWVKRKQESKITRTRPRKRSRKKESFFLFFLVVVLFSWSLYWSSSFFLPCFLFSWSLSWSSYFFLVFLLFLFSFFKYSHFRRRCTTILLTSNVTDPMSMLGGRREVIEMTTYLEICFSSLFRKQGMHIF